MQQNFRCTKRSFKQKRSFAQKRMPIKMRSEYTTIVYFPLLFFFFETLGKRGHKCPKKLQNGEYTTILFFEKKSSKKLVLARYGKISLDKIHKIDEIS